MDCVILTSGKATRLYPLTLDTPKVLLPIGATTILDDILNKVLKLEFIDNIIMSASNNKVMDYLSNNPKYSNILNRITVIEEPNAIGVIKTLELVKPHVKSNEFLLIFPDELFLSEIKNIRAMYANAKKTTLSVGVRKMNNKVIYQYSRLEFSNKDVKKIIEKPTDNVGGFSTIGRYIIPTSGLDLLNSEQKSISDLLNSVIDSGFKLSYNIYKGVRFDTGGFLGYNSANKYFSKKGL